MFKYCKFLYNNKSISEGKFVHLEQFNSIKLMNNSLNECTLESMHTILYTSSGSLCDIVYIFFLISLVIYYYRSTY